MPLNYPYIQVPFANGGDRQNIPWAQDPTGAVSFTQGYGPDYQRELGVDPLAKAIERAGMNQLFYAVSAAVKGWQESCFPDWVPASETGGSQLPYQIGTVVGFSVEGVRTLYVSLTANNTGTPGTSANWQPWAYRVGSTAEVTAGVGAFPATVSQVRSMITAFAPAPPAASLVTPGIVQLSSALNDSADESKAATPAAVARKLGGAIVTLGSTNIDTLTTAAQRGVYWQDSDAAAITGNGYPSGASAGTLYVTGLVNGAAMQMYVTASGAAWTRSRNSGNTAWLAWASVGGAYGTPIVAADYDALGANGQYIFEGDAANRPPSFGASWAIHFVASGDGGTVAYDTTSNRVAYRPITPGGFGPWRDLDMLNTARTNVVAASSVDLTSLAGNTRHVRITGAATINNFVVATGQCYFATFEGGSSLVNSGSLVTGVGTTIRCSQNDTCVIYATAANTVQIYFYKSAVYGQRLVARDAKPSGTNGGTYTSGADRTRDLALVSNSITGASLTSNQITLPAGKYRVTAITAAYAIGQCRAKLANVAGPADLLVSVNARANNDTGVYCVVEGVTTLAASTTCELRIRGTVTNANIGLGRPCSFDAEDEIYSEVIIERLE